MGLFMAVQTIERKEEPIAFIQIPDRIPQEIIENDSLLTLESNLNKVEDKLVITARSVLGITSEMKIQLFEIERLEKTILSMHDYMVRQSSRIEYLENQVKEIIEKDEKNEKDQRDEKKSFGKGFFNKLFLKK
jgi:hypothetical protein